MRTGQSEEAIIRTHFAQQHLLRKISYHPSFPLYCFENGRFYTNRKIDHKIKT